MTETARARACAGAMLVTALTGCGGDDGGDDSGATGADVTGSTAALGTATPEPVAVDGIEAPAPGRARVVLGSSLDLVLAVDSCVREPGAEPDGEVPGEQIAIEATGERSDGAPVVLLVQRFVTAGAAATITDTVTVVEGATETPERVSVAQRFEVGGSVTDVREPGADDPLLRVREGVIEASGVFAAPGAVADDAGLLEGLVSVTCED